MTQHLGIVLIIAGAALLLVGIWLVRKPVVAAVLPQGSTMEVAHPGTSTTIPDTATTALDLLAATIEAALASGVITPKEEKLIRKRALAAGEDADALLVKLRQQLQEEGNNAEVELVDVNQKAGYDFEKYVITLLDQKYFKLDRWAGDKFVAGRYAAENHDPDLQMRLVLGEQEYPLAIECKWRSSAWGDFIRFATEKQLAHYQAFERDRGVPTFVALGIGGKPDAPERLCIIPVAAVKSHFLHVHNAKLYDRGVDRPLYFDTKAKQVL